jgi:hypothetical protein
MLGVQTRVRSRSKGKIVTEVITIIRRRGGRFRGVWAHGGSSTDRKKEV